MNTRRITNTGEEGEVYYFYGFTALRPEYVKVRVGEEVLVYDEDYQVDLVDQTIGLRWPPNPNLPVLIWRETEEVDRLVVPTDLSHLNGQQLALLQLQLLHLIQENVDLLRPLVPFEPGQVLSRTSSSGPLEPISPEVGEITLAENMPGEGVGVFRSKSGVVLQFRRVRAGDGIIVTYEDPEIVVSVDPDAMPSGVTPVNVGSGAELIGEIVLNSAPVRSLVSLNPQLTINTAGDEIAFDGVFGEQIVNVGDGAKILIEDEGDGE
jgi:hypothetical protein